jgi:hypothetical protein
VGYTGISSLQRSPLSLNSAALSNAYRIIRREEDAIERGGKGEGVVEERE